MYLFVLARCLSFVYHTQATILARVVTQYVWRDRKIGQILMDFGLCWSNPEITSFCPMKCLSNSKRLLYVLLWVKILYKYGPVLNYHGIFTEHWEENHGLNKTILFGHHISYIAVLFCWLVLLLANWFYCLLLMSFTANLISYSSSERSFPNQI
jgi:hypothetical protein